MYNIFLVKEGAPIIKCPRSKKFSCYEIVLELGLIFTREDVVHVSNLWMYLGLKETSVW